jgi:two-component system, NtrC family, nitrogen regulation response regulator NtrX
MSTEILVVDDEADIRELVAGILEDEGYRTRTARNADEALAAVRARRPHLMFLDIWLQGSRLDGLQLLEEIKEIHPDLPIVMISGHGNIETAVSAIQKGAYDFIEKPFKSDRLLLVASRALETSQLKREVKALRVKTGDTHSIIGKSSVLSQLRQQIERVAPTNARVLITGGAGTGKELAARNIHTLSARPSGPFVVLNAATIAPETMEEHLFGVEAQEGRALRMGALEEAHGGTLYLDEVSEMPRDTQSKILRVLVDQNFLRVGGSARISVDVRVISSTSRDLTADISNGRFREDLYHRLNVVPLRVPDLAERRDDVPDLITHFMEQISQANGIPMRRIAHDAMAVLQSHEWPGNIRQLRNNVERLMIMTAGDSDAEVTADMLPQELGSMAPPTPGGAGGEKLLSLPLRDAREVFEREYLIAQISRFGGNISKTAEFIGMERSALHRKLKALGVGGL